MISVLKTAMTIDSVKLNDIAAAMLEQIVNGFEKDTMLNADLVRIGGSAQSSKS
jgi:hypothetical protein